jgi:hypothetical protein
MLVNINLVKKPIIAESFIKLFMGRALQYKLSNLIYQSFWISDDINPLSGYMSSFSPE